MSVLSRVHCSNCTVNMGEVKYAGCATTGHRGEGRILFSRFFHHLVTNLISLRDCNLTKSTHLFHLDHLGVIVRKHPSGPLDLNSLYESQQH